MRSTYEQVVALWKSLDGPALKAALDRARWYVKTHGEFGWCVMPADVPSNSGVPLVAKSESYETALKVAFNHNLDVEREMGRQAGVLVDDMSADELRSFLNWMTGYAPVVLLEGLDRWRRPYPSSAALDEAHELALANDPDTQATEWSASTEGGADRG